METMRKQYWPGVLLLTCLAALLCVGCACPLKESVRQRARPKLNVSIVRDNIDQYKGTTVIWGGSVLECRNKEEGTELTILESPLGPACRPGEPRESRGRFLARTDGFLDPQVYSKGTEVVLGGELVGTEKREVGGANYTYPVVNIADIYVFSAEEPEKEYHGPPMWFYDAHPYRYRHPYPYY